MHGSMRRGLETEHPAMVTQRSGPQGKPGEKWLRDLTPDNATAPAPDPTSDNWPARLSWPDSPFKRLRASVGLIRRLAFSPLEPVRLSATWHW